MVSGLMFFIKLNLSADQYANMRVESDTSAVIWHNYHFAYRKFIISEIDSVLYTLVVFSPQPPTYTSCQHGGYYGTRGAMTTWSEV
jgi:hypothetical protein